MSKNQDTYQKVRLEPKVIKRIKDRLDCMPCPPSLTSYVNWMLMSHMDNTSFQSDSNVNQKP